MFEGFGPRTEKEKLYLEKRRNVFSSEAKRKMGMPVCFYVEVEGSWRLFPPGVSRREIICWAKSRDCETGEWLFGGQTVEPSCLLAQLKRQRPVLLFSLPFSLPSQFLSLCSILLQGNMASTQIPQLLLWNVWTLPRDLTMVSLCNEMPRSLKDMKSCPAKFFLNS